MHFIEITLCLHFYKIIALIKLFGFLRRLMRDLFNFTHNYIISLYNKANFRKIFNGV